MVRSAFTFVFNLLEDEAFSAVKGIKLQRSETSRAKAKAGIKQLAQLTKVSSVEFPSSHFISLLFAKMMIQVGAAPSDWRTRSASGALLYAHSSPLVTRDITVIFICNP